MTDRYDPNDNTSYGGQSGGENQGPGGGQGNYPSGGYGQPGRPSQPYQGRPSQPYQGSSSQPYQGSPSQPYQGQYGQPGAPNPSYGQFGQPGPASQPYYNQQTVYTQPPAPKKSRRGLKIALTLAAVVLVLFAIGGGVAVFFINQFAAPGVAALQFCNQLKSQNYDGAYGTLSSGLQSQYSKTAFSAGVSALDTAEGKVIGCQQAQGSNAYTYSLGSSTATVQAQITRGIQGNLTGALHMKNQSGTWKVDGLDTSLLGVNIGALAASGAFCAAMQGADYTTAYGMLDSAQQGLVSQDDFVASGKLHDQIDGTVTKCTLAKVPQGNTDQLSHLTIDLTRSKLGDRTGDVTLKLEGTAWKIDATDTSINGTDLRPLVVGAAFCVLLSTAKYADAYGLFSSAYQANITQADFVANVGSFQGQAIKWTCDAPDYSTYNVANTTASVILPMTIAVPALGTAATSTDKYKVDFVVESGAWKIDNLTVQG